MRKITHSIYFIVLCLFLLCCKEGLNLSPLTSYSEATFFKTADQYKLFANQFYLNLPIIGYKATRDLYADLYAGYSINPISDGSYFPEPASDTWTNSYITIRNTTYLVQKGDAADAELKDKVAVYVGEAKVFRALAYFDLLRDFGGVPIIDKVLDLSDHDLLYGSRNSREEVYNYIMADLDGAISILPVESAIQESDKGRISKGAALALKARFALFEGTWRKSRGTSGFEALLDKAIEASDQIMTSGEYQIFDRRDVLGDESYKYFFILDKKKSNSANLTKVDQKEYILANRFDEVLRGQENTGVTTANPTKKFADMFVCTDGLPIEKSPLFHGKLTITSEYENRDLRMKNIFVIPGTQLWIWTPAFYARDWSNPLAGGYPDVPYGSNVVVFGKNTATGYVEHKFLAEVAKCNVDFPVIRYAEVLLINAEAMYEKSSAITDAQLDLTINKLRTRAGIASLTNSFVSANGLDMRNEIRRERTIELFKEGQRFDDLRRWKTAETELPQALKGVLWAGTQYATDPQYSGVVFPLDTDGAIIIEVASKRHFADKNYLFPLPTRQLLINPQLEQNPGW